MDWLLCGFLVWCVSVGLVQAVLRAWVVSQLGTQTQCVSVPPASSSAVEYSGFQ